MRIGGSSSAALLMGLVLVGVWPAGCQKKPQLTEVKTPDEGLTLAYDLTPGQTYEGTVHLRSAIQSQLGEIVNILEFDVKLLVSGVGSDETRLVVATIDEIGFDLRLPEGIPAAAAGGMNAEVASSLDGMELRFKLGSHGDVTELPEPPADQPPPVQQMIQSLTGAVAAALVRVPATAVKSGESWEVPPTEVQQGVTSTGKGTLTGVVRDENSGEDLAKLQLQGTSKGTVEAQGQKFDISSEQEAEVLFSMAKGFPVHIERKRRSDGPVSAFTEITADWKKGAKEAVEIVPEAETQAITDPCDPDYVGPEACEEGGAEPAQDAAEAADEAEKTSDEADAAEAASDETAQGGKKAKAKAS